MSPHQNTDHEAEDARRAGVVLRPFAQHALLILWPAFVMAAVLEALVFAALDPTALRGFDFDAAGLSASAIYSVTFMIFWGVIATSGAITQLLHAPGPEVPHPPQPPPPQPHPPEQHARDT